MHSYGTAEHTAEARPPRQGHCLNISTFKVQKCNLGKSQDQCNKKVNIFLNWSLKLSLQPLFIMKLSCDLHCSAPQMRRHCDSWSAVVCGLFHGAVCSSVVYVCY